jgi:predicted amidohydrolase YtcJ
MSHSHWRLHPLRPAAWKTRRCGIGVTAWAVATLAFAVSMTGLASGAPPQGAPADLVLLGGKVFTADTARPWAAALAISGERVLTVGDDDAVRALAGPRTRVIELKGRVVVPGFNDAHMHIAADRGGVRLDFGEQQPPPDPSMAVVLDALRRTVAKAPLGSWILSGQISAAVLDSPTPRYALDGVAPDHPVMLTADTGHGSVLNSAALRALGHNETIRDPPGGKFLRDRSGRLTGVLIEYAHTNAVTRQVSRRSVTVHRTALREASAEALRAGITSVQSIASNIAPAPTLQALRESRLPIRLRVIPMPTTDPGATLSTWHAAERAWPLPENGSARVAGVKWMLDGTPLERQAAFRAPYADRPGRAGVLNFSDDEIRTRLREALAQPPGVRNQLLFHTCGDRSAEQVLRLMKELAPAEAWRQRRVRLEHAEGLFEDLLPLARELGVIVVENPGHFADPPGLSLARLGPERVRQYQPLRSLEAAGIPIALGSDGVVDPFLNLMYATAHPNNPREAVSRETAVIAYTRGSAYAEFAEHDKGRLAPGQLADLAVLSQDIFTVDTRALPDTTSVMTVVGGRIVHDAGVLAISPAASVDD